MFLCIYLFDFICLFVCFLLSVLNLFSFYIRFKNLFDYVVLGIHSKNIFEKAADILKPDGKVLGELSTYMAAFEDKNKLAMKEKYKTIGNEHGFILDDQSCKYMWKYIHRPKKEEIIDN